MSEYTFGSGDGASLSMGTLLSEDGGAYLVGDFEGKMSYQGMCRRRLWKRVSLFVGAPMGNLGVGGGEARLLEILRDSQRAPEMEHLSLWEFF
jgi:hypothetical protein